MARVTQVNAARKDQGRCSRCGDPIPKGAAYQHASPGFRGSKIVRCLKFECRFRTSDLTTSHLAQVYAAVEGAEDDLAALENPDDVEGILEPVIEAAREVAEMYEEAAEAMGEAGYESQERADSLNAYADELEGLDVDADCAECDGTGDLYGQAGTEDDPDREECGPCEGKGVDLEGLREEVQAALDGLDV